MSNSDFPEKLLARNNRFFDETIMNFYRLGAKFIFPICDDKIFWIFSFIFVKFLGVFLLALY